jgi:SAM-dependent methyltransferase
MSTLSAKWSDGVASEIHFWRQWIEKKGAAWPEDFSERFDPSKKFSPWLESILPFSSGSTVEVLDVGSGPITSLGYASERYRILITATDALAKSYNELLAEANLPPPVRTQECKAEHLKDFFGNKRFDVCHSRNALDHCIDPRVAILNMCELLKPNGVLFIEVYREEGERENYEGLHNWNFSNESGHLILWRQNERYDISADTASFGESKLSDHGRSLIFVLNQRSEPIAN